MNALVIVGQLVYKGLVAFGTFLRDLGQAIWDWGMRALGAVRDAVVGAVQRAADSFGQFINWIVDFAIRTFEAALQGILSAAKAVLDVTIGGIAADLSLAKNSPSSFTGMVSGVAGRILALVAVLTMIPVAIRVAEASIAAATAGIGWLVTKLVSKPIAEFIVKTLAITALTLSVAAVFGDIFESTGCVEKAVAEFLGVVAAGVAAVATAAEFALKLFPFVHAKVRALPTPVKSFWGVGLSLASLAFAILGGVYQSGLGLALVDVVALVLSILGLAIYHSDSQKAERKALDLVSSIGAAFEGIVAYASPAVAGTAIGFHIAQGKYNG